MEDLFDENRRIKLFDEECDCCCEDEECDCEHDDEECECGCHEDEALQDGYHVLYCRGCLFDAVKIIEYAKNKEEKRTSKPLGLYQNFVADMPQNYISEDEPVILLEFSPDYIDYTEIVESDLKGRGYVLLTGAPIIEKAYKEDVESIDYVMLKAEEFLPFMLFGIEDFAINWNDTLEERIHAKEQYENYLREKELSCE